ncbi:MAG: rod shape-determining protein MreC [Nitrospirae bacterium]|nr:rod shape-determining protein MreC [Nitrospirota bacterium]MBF0536100.1 rod shape-determining protein MreC [Nitrospirota bacterium]MBF0616836.1 rod shape-determining protein MreC [Nitrospirota bacterium]
MLKKHHTLFLIYVFFLISLMTYQSFRGPFQPILCLRYPLFLVNDVIDTAISIIRKPFVLLFTIEGENVRLKSELNRLLLKEQQYDEAINQNKRLSALLLLKGETINYVSAARVIARQPNKWYHQIILDSGTKAGIKKDMAIRTDKGLIGKIISTESNYSTVQLLTDVYSSVAVRLEDNRTEAVLSGTGSELCLLKYIPVSEDVKAGESLVTSGTDNLFPAGIPVGRVLSVERVTSGMFHEIKVELFAQPTKVEEVIIVSREGT